MTTTDSTEGIQAAIEAAQLRAAANQYRLKLRLHNQSAKDIRTTTKRPR